LRSAVAPTVTPNFCINFRLLSFFINDNNKSSGSEYT